MSSGFSVRTIAAAAVAVGLAMSAATAEAAPIQVRDGNGGNVFNGGPGSVNLTIKVDGANTTVAAGAFALEYRFGNAGDWAGFLTYCLEPDELLGLTGNTPVNGNFVGNLASTAEYGGVAAAITGLFNTWFAHSITSAAKSAAFQVALWELAYDAGSDLASGDFQLVNSASVANQANAYLNQDNWISGDPVGVILRVGNQDLVLQIPVPEPAAAALLCVGLLGLGFAARRRRTASATA